MGGAGAQRAPYGDVWPTELGSEDVILFRATVPRTTWATHILLGDSRATASGAMGNG